MEKIDSLIELEEVLLMKSREFMEQNTFPIQSITESESIKECNLLRTLNVKEV